MSSLIQVLHEIGNRPAVDAAAMQHYEKAAELLEKSVNVEELPEFITLSAYQTYQ